MAKLPKISLIIPSYNAASTIERSISSVVSQDYPFLELILIDGASTDRTMQVVQRYAPHFSHIVSEPDKGQANALNKGFRLATGEIFGWLCADDELAPGSLLEVAHTFAKYPNATMVTGACCRHFADGTEQTTAPDTRALERVSFYNGIEQPSTFWKSSIHRIAGELPEDYNYAFDQAWWNELKKAGATLALTSHTLSTFHFSADNKTSKGGTALVREMYRVTKQYGPLNGYLADVYMFLYRHFDLKGYYDAPLPKMSFRRLYFSAVRRILSCAIGSDLIKAYNWHFASRQERQLCWYK